MPAFQSALKIVFKMEDAEKMTRLKLTLLLSVLGGWAAVVAVPAFSQQLPGAIPGTQTDDVMPRPTSKPPEKSLIQVQPEVLQAPVAAPGAGAAITVTRFTFSGNTSQSQEQLAPLVAAFAGKALTLDQLNEAAGAIRRHYRDHGWFLAQAYIPVQAIKDGVVDIAVLEGRIDKVTIKVHPDAPVSAAYAEKLAAAFLQPGQAITENGIERPLLLLRDVPRIDTESVIDPGSTLGSASITVNVVKDESAPVISGQVELDNFGSRFSGRNRLGAEINVNNPYGLGDQLSLRGFIADTGGNAFGRAGYSLPVGSWGTRVGASIARLEYVLGEELAVFEPYGVANIFSANVSHPLIRSKYNNLYGQLIVERKNLTDRTTAPVSSETSSISSLRLQVNGDAHDSLAGLNLYSISLMHGSVSLDNPDRRSLDQDILSGPHTEGSFAKLAYSIQRLQQVMPNVQAMLSLSGQLSNKNLAGAEKFAVGGAGTVRAFPVGELIGDTGYAATAEVRYAVPQLKVGNLDVVGTLFYDFGHVTKNHDNRRINASNNERSISGYGIGVNFGYGEKHLLKLAVAWPGAGISENEPDKKPRFLAQAIFGF
jgi:hemolysin activation/secretion protein